MKNLEIEFHSGLVYQYSGVPTKVYNDLISSSAVGKYFSDKVRNRFRAKQTCRINLPQNPIPFFFVTFLTSISGQNKKGMRYFFRCVMNCLFTPSQFTRFQNASIYFARSFL